jgi:hypothetical protein
MGQFVAIHRQQLEKEQERAQAREDAMLEPRDRPITVELPDRFSRLTQESLERFMSQLCKRVWSMAFNAFSRQEMTFENTKIYASEQIMRNLVRLCERFPLGKEEFRIFNQHLQSDTVSYMWHKYPMTVSQEVNRNLNRVVKEVDHRNLPENSYLNNVNFAFKYRETGEYNDFIMKTINEVLRRTNVRIQSNSIYERFELRISELFELVMDSDYMAEKEKEDKEKHRSSDNLD